MGPHTLSPHPKLDPHTCGFVPCSLSISSRILAWEEELVADSDRVFFFLLEGIRGGFRITEQGSQFEDAQETNHPSTLQYRDLVEEELIEQIKLGNYVVASNKPTVVSALAAIPKTNGKVRLIHDGSRPVGSAMNDYSIPDTCSAFPKFTRCMQPC